MLNNSLIVLILDLLSHKDNYVLKLVLSKAAQLYVHIYFDIQN